MFWYFVLVFVIGMVAGASAYRWISKLIIAATPVPAPAVAAQALSSVPSQQGKTP